MGKIGGVYEVLSWMTGESVYTHQIPRISREAEPVLIAAHPALAQAVAEAEQVNPVNVAVWRDLWLERYGPTIAVPRFKAEDHEAIDPISELVEKVHPSKIMTVLTGSTPSKPPGKVEGEQPLALDEGG